MKFLGKLLTFITRRLTIAMFLVFLQFLFLGLAIYAFSSNYVYVNAALLLLSLTATLVVVNNNDDPGYKLTWAVTILVAPIFGGLLYLAVGGQKLDRVTRKRIPYEPLDATVEKDWTLSIEDVQVRQQARYIQQKAGFSPQGNTAVTYYPTGETMFQGMLDELEKAKHFIFLEFFIIEEGKMFNSIVDILERKAREGVDVRMIYDDMGSVKTVPLHYYKKLREKGIQCYPFNRVVPFIFFRMNNRTHRKILVIDGCTGFTGGINLADEYINERERFGHWKDTGVMLKGAAVWNLTAMFLHTWSFVSGNKEPIDRTLYEPQMYAPLPETEGLAAPYGCSPISPYSVSSAIYCNMISKAKEYIYITTPYLILNHEIKKALMSAAQNGVDVRILTPAKWDKYLIHILTQSFYKELIHAGVRIYEYTPGFIHAKSFVCDDELAIVGTINLDYRSLYLHFECACWMYQVPAVADVKKDFLETEALCEPITDEFIQKRPLFRRMIGWIIKVFAPLA